MYGGSSVCGRYAEPGTSRAPHWRFSQARCRKSRETSALHAVRATPRAPSESRRPQHAAASTTPAHLAARCEATSEQLRVLLASAGSLPITDPLQHCARGCSHSRAAPSRGCSSERPSAHRLPDHAFTIAGSKSRHHDRDMSAPAPTSNPSMTTPILSQQASIDGLFYLSFGETTIRADHIGVLFQIVQRGVPHLTMADNLAGSVTASRADMART